MKNERPQFETPEDWLAAHDQALREGWRPWEPATREELLLADELGLLDVHPEWIPGSQALSLLNLPDHFGRSLSAFDERFRERFLATLVQDDLFRTAVAHCLNLNGGPE